MNQNKKMSKLEILNSLLHRFGFELGRYNKGVNSILRRRAFLEKYNVDLIIDVGANTGIFGNETRWSGYKVNIVSFEPLSDAFEKLLQNTAGDTRWKSYNFALGAENSKGTINISSNSHSSSILDISDIHLNAESSAPYSGKQEIEIKTLDSIFDQIGANANEIYMKIDTQGFEMNVLNGASGSLRMINTIQLEMSLHPLYSNQALYNDIMNFLHSRGYKLIDIEPGFADLKTGTLYQFDGVFRKSDRER